VPRRIHPPEREACSARATRPYTRGCGKDNIHGYPSISMCITGAGAHICGEETALIEKP